MAAETGVTDELALEASVPFADIVTA